MLVLRIALLEVTALSRAANLCPKPRACTEYNTSSIPLYILRFLRTWGHYRVFVRAFAASFLTSEVNICFKQNFPK